MRVGQAAQNLQKLNPNVSPDDNGLERFITATRRQNLLVPPRRHRSSRWRNSPEDVNRP